MLQNCTHLWLKVFYSTVLRLLHFHHHLSNKRFTEFWKSWILILGKLPRTFKIRSNVADNCSKLFPVFRGFKVYNHVFEHLQIFQIVTQISQKPVLHRSKAQENREAEPILSIVSPNFICIIIFTFPNKNFRNLIFAVSERCAPNYSESWKVNDSTREQFAETISGSSHEIACTWSSLRNYILFVRLKHKIWNQL